MYFQCISYGFAIGKFYSQKHFDGTMLPLAQTLIGGRGRGGGGGL